MKKFAIISAVFGLALLLMPVYSQAQEPVLTTDELISLVGQSVVDEATQADENLKKAKDVLDAARQAGTKREQEAAEQDYMEAEEAKEDADRKLDEARVDAFANECGKSSSEIQAMRNSGMGWGRIAKECGAHPSTAGKGKGKGKDKWKNSGSKGGKGKKDKVMKNKGKK